MSIGINKMMGLGNLGKDPEVRYAQSGTAVCNLSVALTTRQKKGDAWEDVTEWAKVVVFGKTAESCGQFLTKGRQVYFEGRLSTRKWQDKDGKDQYSTEIVADQVLFLGGASGGASGGGTEGGDRGKAKHTTKPADKIQDMEDIAF